MAGDFQCFFDRPLYLCSVGISAGPGLIPGSWVPELVPGPWYWGAGTGSTLIGAKMWKISIFFAHFHSNLEAPATCISNCSHIATSEKLLWDHFNSKQTIQWTNTATSEVQYNILRNHIGRFITSNTLILLTFILKYKWDMGFNVIGLVKCNSNMHVWA